MPGKHEIPMFILGNGSIGRGPGIEERHCPRIYKNMVKSQSNGTETAPSRHC